MKNENAKSEKGKLLLRTYLMSLLSLMLCVTMLLGTTFAWFTSEVKTSGNEIYVGKLAVDLTAEVKNDDGTTRTVSLKDSQTPLFGSTEFKWEPGATQIETVNVVNYGDLAFDYALYISTVAADAGALDEVGKYIDVYITANGATANSFQDIQDTWIRVGTLSEVVANGYLLANGSYIPDSNGTAAVVDTVRIALHMPAEVSDTSIMGKKIENLGIKLIATQKVAEEDDFGAGYDEAAPVDALVGSYDELAAAVTAGQSVRLTTNITVRDNTTLTVASGKTVVIDLNGYTLSGTASGTGANRELFLVKGNLIVKGVKNDVTTAAEGEATVSYEGGIVYEYTKGENDADMDWNNMTTVFDITAGGSVQLVDVKVENKGGTDMNFVAHLNNWGSASLYMDGAYLYAPYCAIRVFNSGYDMNNVVAKDSTIASDNRALWVHNYIGDLDSTNHSDAAVDARLNISILNGSNTVVGDIRYGFTNAVFHVIDNDGFVRAVEKGASEVVLQADFAVSDPVEIAADTAMVIDLNGHTISGESNLIVNNGTLTIEGQGEIAVTFTGTVNNNEAVNTISNRGVLTVNGGKISNTGKDNQIGYAIDNYNGAVLTVNGGEIVASDSTAYDAIRLFCGDKETIVTVNGGSISSIWAQNPTANKATEVKGTVIVNGGTVQTVYYERYTTVKVADGVETTVTPFGEGSGSTTSVNSDGYTTYSFVIN